jgi:hypothetical protein
VGAWEKGQKAKGKGQKAKFKIQGMALTEKQGYFLFSNYILDI